MMADHMRRLFALALAVALLALPAAAQIGPSGPPWRGSGSLAPNGTVYDLVRDFGDR